MSKSYLRSPILKVAHLTWKWTWISGELVRNQFRSSRKDVGCTSWTSILLYMRCSPFFLPSAVYQTHYIVHSQKHFSSILFWDCVKYIDLFSKLSLWAVFANMRHFSLSVMCWLISLISYQYYIWHSDFHIFYHNSLDQSIFSIFCFEYTNLLIYFKLYMVQLLCRVFFSKFMMGGGGVGLTIFSLSWSPSGMTQDGRKLGKKLSTEDRMPPPPHTHTKWPILVFATWNKLSDTDFEL